MTQIYEQLLEYVKLVIFNGLLGLTLIEILIFFIIFLIAFSIRNLFAKFIVHKIEKIVKKTSNNADNLIFDTLVGPLKLIPVIIIFIFLSFNINEESKFLSFIEKFNQSLVTIFIFWLLHTCFSLFSDSLSKLEKLLSKALTIWLTNSIKYIIIFLGAVAILEVWGIKIGPVIAGLGLFGVAVALGAQDLFKNLISGVLILVEKKFHIGDVINIPNFGDGTVEQIGFRSTTIRKFDTTPITIPNHILSDNAISNYSNRSFRRISWVIGLEYSTTVEQLKNITDDIHEYIKKEDEKFIINNNYQCFVRLEKFNDSSIDILIYCFTNTNSWEKFLLIKEELALQLKVIVEKKNNANFAFPSQSIYIEKNNKI